MPLILGGGDVMAAAETGSGKTGAFALPVLQIVHEALRSRQLADKQAGTGSGTVDAAAAATAAAAAGPAAAAAAACILNGEDRDDVVAIAPDGLRCQARSEAAWGGCRATMGALSGKVYYEATVSDEGLCRSALPCPAAAAGLVKPNAAAADTGRLPAAASTLDVITDLPALAAPFPSLSCACPCLWPPLPSVPQGGLVQPGRLPGPGD